MILAITYYMSTYTIPAPGTTTVSAEQIAHYRQHGFVKVPSILTPEEVALYYAEALREARENAKSKQLAGTYRAVLNQKVNAWTENQILRRLTFHPVVTAVAKTLAGVQLRLWHDHILCKEPHNGANTEWHQDLPYWPLKSADNALSCWIALCDVPADRGCMSFMPGQQHRSDLAMQILTDPRSLFEKDPALEYEPKVTIPLRAGECTFHHGRTPHMANANITDEWRVAHVVIYTDRDSRYADDVPGGAKSHVVTGPLNLKNGSPLPEAMFPEI